MVSRGEAGLLIILGIVSVAIYVTLSVIYWLNKEEGMLWAMEDLV